MSDAPTPNDALADRLQTAAQRHAGHIHGYLIQLMLEAVAALRSLPAASDEAKRYNYRGDGKLVTVDDALSEPKQCEHADADNPCMCGSQAGLRGSSDCICHDCEAMGCPGPAPDGEVPPPQGYMLAIRLMEAVTTYKRFTTSSLFIESPGDALVNVVLDVAAALRTMKGAEK